MGRNDGSEAENRAAAYLEAAGLTLLARNWRNRWCEIDLIARDEQTVHIVEVKYRARTAWGSAAEYVTSEKLERLRRAAAAWQQANRYTGPIQIDVVTLEGPLDRLVITWLPNVVTD